MKVVVDVRLGRVGLRYLTFLNVVGTCKHCFLFTSLFFCFFAADKLLDFVFNALNLKKAALHVGLLLELLETFEFRDFDPDLLLSFQGRVLKIARELT